MTSMMQNRLRLCFGFAAVVFSMAFPMAANAATAVTTSNVNLREGPSADYRVIMTVPASAAVDVEGCAQGWCKVDYSGTEGWMSEEFLQGLASPPTIVLPVPFVVPGPHYRPPHYGHRPPHYRPPVVLPRPPHRPPHGGPPPRPRPPGIHPPPQPRPPHHRPPGPHPPGVGKPPGIHPPPQHRPPGGGGGNPGHRPPPSGGKPGGGRPGGGVKTQN